MISGYRVDADFLGHREHEIQQGEKKAHFESISENEKKPEDFSHFLIF